MLKVYWVARDARLVSAGVAVVARDMANALVEGRARLGVQGDIELIAHTMESAPAELAERLTELTSVMSMAFVWARAEERERCARIAFRRSRYAFMNAEQRAARDEAAEIAKEIQEHTDD